MHARRRRQAFGLVALFIGLLTACGGGDKVTVSPPIPQVALVTLTPSDTTLDAGQTIPLMVMAADASGNVVAVSCTSGPGYSCLTSGRPVSWASTHTSVATVSAAGLVTAVAIGSARITATVEGKTASSTITVTPDRSAVELVFTEQPGFGDAGLPLTRAIQVTARDQFGGTAVSFNGIVQVTLGENPGDAELTGDPQVFTKAGVATFTNLRVSQGGKGYTLIASAFEPPVGQRAERKLSATSKAFEIAPESATGQIAFVRASETESQIYLISTDGSGATRLTNAPAEQYQPAWSPDGMKIAFVGFVGGSAQIFVVNVDGSKLVQLTTDSTDAYQPAWSPDGARIAFSRSTATSADICVMNADGSGITVLFPGEFSLYNMAPAWSPDGSTIAFLWFNDLWTNIYVMNADGSGAAWFGRNEPYDFVVGAPAWSPDGRLLFWSDWARPGFTRTSGAGSAAKRISGNVASRDYSRASWSPQGSRIVFEGTPQAAGGADPYSMSDIYVMNANGSGTIRLTTGGVGSQPAWRPRPK
jgi:Tol biopolymer transport system component